MSSNTAIEAASEIALLDQVPRFCVDLVERIVLPVEHDELCRPRGEEDPLLQHLHFGAKFE